MQSMCLPRLLANSLPLLHLLPRTTLSLSDHVGSEMYTCSCDHVWIGVKVRKMPDSKIKSRSTLQPV